MKKETLHNDENAWLYIYKVDGTHLSERKHVLLNYKDERTFFGTYEECVDYFNTNESKVLHPDHPRLLRKQKQ